VVPALIGLVSGWLSDGTAEGSHYLVSLPDHVALSLPLDLLDQLVDVMPAVLVAYLLTRSGEGLAGIGLDRSRLTSDAGLLFLVMILAYLGPMLVGKGLLEAVGLEQFTLASRTDTRATPAPPWQTSRTMACWSSPAEGWAANAARTASWDTTAVCSPIRWAAATSRSSTASSSGVDQRRSSRARSVTTATARSAQNRSGQVLELGPVGAGQLAAEGGDDVLAGEGGRGRGQPGRTGQSLEHLGHRRLGQVLVAVACPTAHLPDQGVRVVAALGRFRPPPSIQGVRGLVVFGLASGVDGPLDQPGCPLPPRGLQPLHLQVDLAGALGEQPHEVFGQALQVPVPMGVRCCPLHPSVRDSSRW
jgi:hypothetical protein